MRDAMEEGKQGFELAMVATKKSEEEKEAAFLKSLPAGYKFKPLDVELVNYYLKRKVYGLPLPANIIREVHLYDNDPETLTGMSNNKSSNGVVDEWYFFTPRDRKYRTGTRPGRGAGNGYWKATGADKKVLCEENLVGLKKTLVFYKGKQPKGQKTDWTMHEYVLSNPPARERTSNDDMRLDDWVLCRLYKKQRDPKSKPITPQERTDQKQDETEDAAMAAHTETQLQEYCGIHQPPQFEQFQDQASNMLPLPQQASSMPLYNAYDYITVEELFQESFDSVLEQNSAIFGQQAALSDYGNFIPTATPFSSYAPLDQFHFMGNANSNIHPPLQLPPQHQFLGVNPNNFDFSAADQFLLDMDFGLPKP